MACATGRIVQSRPTSQHRPRTGVDRASAAWDRVGRLERLRAIVPSIARHDLTCHDLTCHDLTCPGHPRGAESAMLETPADRSAIIQFRHYARAKPLHNGVFCESFRS
ncbi:MAG: hypothetical protein B7Y95_22205 [Rhizobiales bacterium 32-66-11]|nr:MAG: hypothetical protein B7Y95_22205 [Rhizobiales bacterium 32-66-11]